MAILRSRIFKISSDKTGPYRKVFDLARSGTKMESRESKNKILSPLQNQVNLACPTSGASRFIILDFFHFSQFDRIGSFQIDQSDRHINDP